MTAMVDRTDSVVHLDDDEFAFLSEDDYTVVDSDDVPQAKRETAIEWDAEATDKGRKSFDAARRGCVLCVFPYYRDVSIRQ